MKKNSQTVSSNFDSSHDAASNSDLKEESTNTGERKIFIKKPIKHAEKDPVEDLNEPAKKSYKGMADYKQYGLPQERNPSDVTKNSSSSNSAPQQLGRAASCIKESTVWDYKPDICKDYKETGFCGYGDSCKFLHDRTDYKSGWQIEREIKEGTFGAGDEDPDKYVINSDSDEDGDDQCLCEICGKEFDVTRVKTKCGHFFHEKCALKHFRKTSKCFSCSKDTGGIFNPCKD